MAAGHLYDKVCYATPEAATQAMYFSPSFSTITPGATTYYQIPVMIGNQVNLQGWTISSSGVQTAKWTKAPPVTLFPTCDTSSEFMDGMTLGWGVAIAMIAAYAIKFIAERRAL